MIRATFELEPGGSAEALAVEESTGMEGGPDSVRGRVVEEAGGRAVIEFPASNWDDNVSLLVSSLVVGEAMETGAFSRCRLVALELPEGLLPGPAFPAGPEVSVGVIVKPSLGLAPAEVAEVARAVVAGGASLVKDDEIMGDPRWCPLEERVRAVAAVLEPGVVYTPNITGSPVTLLDRARRVVDLGATGVMLNVFTQGLHALLALRQADLGVPILAHRVGSGPWARSDRFGVSGAVLASLTRQCGADYVMVGAFGGKLFDSEADVRAQLAAVREGGGPAPTAVIGGGIGPDNARHQAERAGGGGLLLLLGSRAYGRPGGLEGAVKETVASLEGVRAGP